MNRKQNLVSSVVMVALAAVLANCNSPKGKKADSEVASAPASNAALTQQMILTKLAEFTGTADAEAAVGSCKVKVNLKQGWTALSYPGLDVRKGAQINLLGFNRLDAVYGEFNFKGTVLVSSMTETDKAGDKELLIITYEGVNDVVSYVAKEEIRIVKTGNKLKSLERKHSRSRTGLAANLPFVDAFAIDKDLSVSCP